MPWRSVSQDDLGLLAPDPIMNQNMLSECEGYAVKWRFSWGMGKGKSEEVVYGNKQQITAPLPPFLLDGCELPVVKGYKYLGLFMTQLRDRWSSHIDRGLRIRKSSNSSVRYASSSSRLSCQSVHDDMEGYGSSDS